MEKNELAYSPIMRMLNGWHPCRKIGDWNKYGERGFYVEATDLAQAHVERRFAEIGISMLDADSPLCPLPPVEGTFADAEKGLIWLKIANEDFIDRIN